jgi:hypothetical protein
MNFFNKMPTITYDGNLSRNIMARAKLSDSTKANSRLFLPYTTAGEDRVDTLSNQYYGSPGYTWLVWLANDTIDPYYDMALNEYDLEQYIIMKYGSIATAQRKIKHYKSNWESEPDGIAVDVYDTLINGTQKYWEPVLDSYLNVKGYRRKQEDQFLNTNRVGIITVDDSSIFKVGEEIQQANNSNVYGFATYTGDGQIGVQHLKGIFQINTTIVGKESGAQAIIRAANSFVSTTAAFDDSRYWQAVSYYDYEVDLNDKKKEIVLLDAMQKNKAEQELTRIMNR